MSGNLVFSQAELVTAMSFTGIPGVERAVIPQYPPRNGSPACLGTTLDQGDTMLLIVELLRTREAADPTPNEMDQILREAAQILNRTCSHNTGFNAYHYWPEITIKDAS